MGHFLSRTSPAFNCKNNNKTEKVGGCGLQQSLEGFVTEQIRQGGGGRGGGEGGESIEREREREGDNNSDGVINKSPS